MKNDYSDLLEAALKGGTGTKSQADAYADILKQVDPNQVDFRAASAVANEARKARIAEQVRQDRVTYDPTNGMGAFDRFFAGAGRGLTNVARGAAQVVGQGPSTAEVDEQRRLDAPLMRTMGGKVGNFVGNTAPFLAIPGGWAGAMGRAAPIIEGAAAGGLQGALDVVGTGDSRGFNTGAGVLGGALLPTVIQGARATLSPSAGPVADLARKAQAEGIPLSPMDLTQNKLVKGYASFMGDVPVLGATIQRQQAAKQAAFNQAVLSKMGEKANTLTDDVMAGAKTRITGDLDRIWKANDLTVDGNLVASLANIRNRAANLPADAQRRVNEQIKDFLSRLNQNNTVPGEFANNFQSALRNKAAGAAGEEAAILNELRQNVVGAFNRSISGADADALRVARSQYGAMKTLEPMLTKANDGNVSPSLLKQVVRQGYGDTPKGVGAELLDLGRIGQQFVADRALQTGGSPRAMIQQVTAGLLPTIPAAGAMANPVAAGLGTLGTAAANTALASPRLGNMLLRQPVQQAPRGLLELQYQLMLRDLAKNAGTALPAAGLLGLVPGAAPLE
ncbi:hypothetical protein IP84_17070 [beta proteobacterium AAP99]|nr:hypothetical protein IP84_17070 [beta proteobacterium AAP99]